MNIKAGFERISKYANDESIIIPVRKTTGSAGYDFYVAEDTIVPSYEGSILTNFSKELAGDLKDYYPSFIDFLKNTPYDLDAVSTFTKKYNHKVTLVPTGIKAYMPQDYYLQMTVRSSLPLKHWLILANGVGIVDSDYYNNPDNEGHIYFELINLLPFDVILKKGDCIGQGIFLQYGTTEGEQEVTTTRTGGHGSTDENSGT